MYHHNCRSIQVKREGNPIGLYLGIQNIRFFLKQNLRNIQFPHTTEYTSKN